jgi:predicted RNA-binding protein (virulence factor B family)
MQQGHSYIVHVHIDEESYRIMASAKVEKFIEPLPTDYAPGQEVDLLIWQKTDLGFKVIIDNKYAGLLYDSQVFTQLHTGDKVRGFISNIRPDGKVDCALQKSGREHTTDFSAKLLKYLESRGGRCWLGDKSSAEEIKAQFGVSKRTYKQAIGNLYKRHLIKITENGIVLL